MGVWRECRYCDSCFPPIKTEDSELICRNCGAEWDPILIDEPDKGDGQ